MQKQIPIKDIRIDGGTQQRDIDDDVLKRYIALMKDGAKFPPVSVVFDGKNHWLWDGFHRFHANRKLGKNYIEAHVEPGSKRDAIWFSFSANKDHGFPRPPGTAKKIIEKIQADEEWKTITDAEIAQWIGVSRRWVSQVRWPQKTDKSSPKREVTSHIGQDESLKASEPKNTDSEENEAEETTDNQPKQLVDATGKQVPEDLVDVFSRANELKVRIHELNAIFREIREGQADNDPLYAYIKLDMFKADIGNVKRHLRFAVPYAICRYCGGGKIEREKCRACDGLGFANERRWKTTAEELK